MIGSFISTAAPCWPRPSTRTRSTRDESEPERCPVRSSSSPAHTTWKPGPFDLVLDDGASEHPHRLGLDLVDGRPLVGRGERHRHVVRLEQREERDVEVADQVGREQRVVVPNLDVEERARLQVPDPELVAAGRDEDGRPRVARAPRLAAAAAAEMESQGCSC